MTDLDRRVAALRGWHIDEQGRVLDSNQMFQYWLTDYPYETNLAHAYELWNEARPEGPALRVRQADFSKQWWVNKRLYDFTDLPRAITEAWVEAMEATCQK